MRLPFLDSCATAIAAGTLCGSLLLGQPPATLLGFVQPAAAADGMTPLSLLVPAFVLSEIQHAFQIGFIVLLPFLVIDLLVASILMAMGMMMVPPAVVSLPFKVAFFVLTNGWVAVSGALVRGYS